MDILDSKAKKEGQQIIIESSVVMRASTSTETRFESAAESKLILAEQTKARHG